MMIDHDWHQEALSDSSFGLGVSLVDDVSVIGETLAPLIDTTNAGPGDCYLATGGDLHLATSGDFHLAIDKQSMAIAAVHPLDCRTGGRASLGENP